MNKDNYLMIGVMTITILGLLYMGYSFYVLFEAADNLRERVTELRATVFDHGMNCLQNCLNGTFNCTKNDIAELAFRLGNL